MKCPDEIAQILLEILGIGILRIRNQAVVNPELCYVEADHLHNLPFLLASYRPELLDFYLDVERPSYLGRGGIAVGYEALWRKLLDLRQSTPTR
jgi:hypothetical protein